MKNIRNFALLITVILGVIGANAQSSSTLNGKVTFPSQVRWGKSTLPAGEYALTIQSKERPVRVMIHSVDGKTAAIALGQISDQQPGNSYVLVTGSGSNQQVRFMNLPQLSISLMYEPLTPQEREGISATASETLPVQIASK
jgi:hypothetical protein